jgi:protein arginine kinase activator
MKCDNCGKEEVNFHYTSNINGNITEKHLCAECADNLGITSTLGITGNLGFDGKSNHADKPDPDPSFEEIFADLFGAKPTRRMIGGFGMVFPTFIIPTVGFVVPRGGPDGEAVQPERMSEIKIEIDDEMRKRREINILREQMRQAAEAEDFEKAAALRDTVRKLEVGESV